MSLVFLLLTLLEVAIAPSAEITLDDKEIERPYQDTRKYHYMQLSNGMKVMLISTDRPDAKFYMDISVSVGSVHSPRRLQGLAHLLEHVVVAQLQDGSGVVGGRTDELHSNFFLESPVEKMFDRLHDARNAIFEPVITEELLSQCMDEVEAEFNCKVDVMHNQLIQLSYKTVLDPRHPVCHFRYGNRGSLAAVSVDELAGLHTKFYSPEVATMALQSSLSLEEMKRRVQRLYWKVPKKPKVLPLSFLAANLRDPVVAATLTGETLRTTQSANDANPGSEVSTAKIPMLHANLLGNYIFATASAIGNLGGIEPEVIFEFYFESERRVRMQSKPLRFLVEVLGHHSRGSLSWALKKQGLVTSVKASDAMSNAAVEILQIKMKLSIDAASKESKAPGSVVKNLAECLFVYLNLFKKGIFSVDPRPLANHVERKVKFLKDPPKPLQFVVDVAQGLRELTDYREAVIGLSLIRKATPQLIKSYWDRLHQDNLAIRLIGEIFVRHCNMVEPYHCVPYGITETPWKVRLAINKAEQMRRGDLLAQARMRGFSIAMLHTPYDTLVSDIAAKHKAAERQSTPAAGAEEQRASDSKKTQHELIEPTLIELTTGANLYLDPTITSAYTSRVEISFFSLWLQHGGLKHFAISQVIRRCYAAILYPELYSATLRGFEHGMNVVENRFIWSFEGPAWGIAHLVQSYAKIIRENQIPHDACKHTLELSKETLGNRVRAMSAGDQAFHWLNMIIKSPFYSEWDMESVISSLDYDRDIRPLANKFWGTIASGAMVKAGVTGAFDQSDIGLNPVDWVVTLVSELWARADELPPISSQPANRRLDPETAAAESDKSHHNVAVKEDDFVDLRERQLRDFTLCRPNLSGRSRSGAVLVSVQLNGGDRFETKQFDATLVVFQAIVNDLFTNYIGDKFRQAHLPHARGEVTAASMRAHIHLLVTGGGDAQAIITAINNFLEQLPSNVIKYDAVEELKVQQAETAAKVLDHPEQRKFYFFNEISRDVPRFTWPRECRDFILAVKPIDLVDFAMQAASAPRIRVVIKHAQDESVAETNFLPESIFKWKTARKGSANRTRSRLSERKRSRSEAIGDLQDSSSNSRS